MATDVVMVIAVIFRCIINIHTLFHLTNVAGHVTQYIVFQRLGCTLWSELLYRSGAPPLYSYVRFQKPHEGGVIIYCPIYTSSVKIKPVQDVRRLGKLSEREYFGILYTVYSVQRTVYSIQHTAYSIEYTVYSIQYTVYRMQYKVYCIQCTAYSIQHTV
jgi:hypothetical protein